MKRYFLSFVWACLLTTNVYAQGHAAESAAVAERVKTVTIVGNQKMIFGPTTDVPASNTYSLIVTDAEGRPIEEDKLNDFRVEWDVEGFKTENDQPGQYCDSYGSFAKNRMPSLETDFKLRNVPMNFYGRMTARLIVGGRTFTAQKGVVALENDRQPDSQVLPMGGYPKEFSAYSDALLGCTVLTESHGQAQDLVFGRWIMAGSDGAKKAELQKDIDGSKFMRISAPTSKKSHVLAKAITPPTSLVVFTSKVRFHDAGDGSWARVLEKEYDKSPLAALCDFSNRGIGGRNLGIYYQQGKLAEVLRDICPGDIVMVGNNGTNGMNSTFEDDLNYYIDAAEAMGAKIIINSYTPHGAVANYAKGYNQTTHTFDNYRRDAYDVVVRKVATQRAQSDVGYLGFVEIGQHADAIFNAYVADFKANGYASKDDAAQAIIKCFKDHNHYNQGELACHLMLYGYPTCPKPGIVAQIQTLLSKTR